MALRVNIIQITATLLNKIDMYSERYSIIREACGYDQTYKDTKGLRDLSESELREVQGWCKRYAASHGILLDGSNKKGGSVTTDFQENKKRESDKNDLMRKKIISYAHSMFWKTPEGKADMNRINNWCEKYGMFKKKLNAHNTQELVLLVTQFEKLYQSHLQELRKSQRQSI